MLFRFRRLAVLLLMIFFLTGCGPDNFNVKVNTTKDMNNNTAMTVMMVFVYDKKMLEQLQKMKVQEWFQKYEELLNSNPGAFSAIQWELVPGQVVDVVRPGSELDDVEGIVVFANYAKPKAGRAVIKDPKDYIIVTVKKSSISVTTTDDKPVPEPQLSPATSNQAKSDDKATKAPPPKPKKKTPPPPKPKRYYPTQKYSGGINPGEPGWNSTKK